jgi:hypothetical protein
MCPPDFLNFNGNHWGYNSKTKICETCVKGCAVCAIDYDYCVECDAGYIWNPNFTCLNSVVGLSAASLAVLVIALILMVIVLVLICKYNREEQASKGYGLGTSTAQVAL